MHWKDLSGDKKYKYLGAYSLEGKSEAIVLTIASCKLEKIETEGGKTDEQMVVRFSEKEKNGVFIKPMIMNATNKKAIEAGLKTGQIESWVGKQIEVYVLKDLLLKMTKEKKDVLRVRMPSVAEPADKRKPFGTDNKNWEKLLTEVGEGKHTIAWLVARYAFTDEALDALMQAADDYNDARIALEILADEDLASAEEARFENEQ